MGLGTKLSAALIVGGFFVGFASAAHANCATSYNSIYGQGQSHKAFAMTASGSFLAEAHPRNAFSCSWALAKPSRAVAISAALKWCNQLRAKNDRNGACRIVRSE